jgi:hypothetical protein
MFMPATYFHLSLVKLSDLLFLGEANAKIHTNNIGACRPGVIRLPATDACQSG